MPHHISLTKILIILLCVCFILLPLTLIENNPYKDTLTSVMFFFLVCAMICNIFNLLSDSDEYKKLLARLSEKRKKE